MNYDDLADFMAVCREIINCADHNEMRFDLGFHISYQIEKIYSKKVAYVKGGIDFTLSNIEKTAIRYAENLIERYGYKGISEGFCFDKLKIYSEDDFRKTLENLRSN